MCTIQGNPRTHEKVFDLPRATSSKQRPHVVARGRKGQDLFFLSKHSANFRARTVRSHRRPQMHRFDACLCAHFVEPLEPQCCFCTETLACAWTDGQDQVYSLCRHALNPDLRSFRENPGGSSGLCILACAIRFSMSLASIPYDGLWLRIIDRRQLNKLHKRWGEKHLREFHSGWRQLTRLWIMISGRTALAVHSASAM